MLLLYFETFPLGAAIVEVAILIKEGFLGGSPNFEQINKKEEECMSLVYLVGVSVTPRC